MRQRVSAAISVRAARRCCHHENGRRGWRDCCTDGRATFSARRRVLARDGDRVDSEQTRRTKLLSRKPFVWSAFAESFVAKLHRRCTRISGTERQANRWRKHHGLEAHWVRQPSVYRTSARLSYWLSRIVITPSLATHYASHEITPRQGFPEMPGATCERIWCTPLARGSANGPKLQSVSVASVRVFSEEKLRAEMPAMHGGSPSRMA